MRVAALSDRGVKRGENEDAYFYDEEDKIFIVADGIGGLSDGAFASEFVVDALRKLIVHNLSGNLDEAKSGLINALKEVNSNLHDLKGGESGATCMVLFIKGSKALFAHAGDSKLYLVRGGDLTQLNSEHSLVWSLWREGLLPKDELSTHPLRNVVERALGLKEALEPESGEAVLTTGDTLLLATDGVAADLSQSDILSIVNSAGEPMERLETLAALSRKSGGSDNFTGILIDI